MNRNVLVMVGGLLLIVGFVFAVGKHWIDVAFRGK